MRICLYTPSLSPEPTGTHITVDALARQFTQRGHLVSVLAMGHEHRMNTPYAVHWIAPPFGRQWFPERAAATLRDFQRANQFEVICCVDAHPTGYAALQVAQEFEIPLVVVSMEGDVTTESPLRRRPHLWKRVLATYRNADTVVAISPSMHTLLEQLEESDALNLVSIHSGVDTESFSRPADRPEDYDDPRPYLLFAGSLDLTGGADDALAAFSKVRDRLDDIVLVMLGDGPQRGILQKRVRQLNLTDRVHFVGWRHGDERRWFMQHHRFALIVPRRACHPTLGLQVAACGRPMICTTPGPFDEICRGGVNGLRVPPESPNTLAEAIMRLQRFDLETMGLNSLEIAQDYDWSQIASRYLELFELLTAGHAAPRSMARS